MEKKAPSNIMLTLLLISMLSTTLSMIPKTIASGAPIEFMLPGFYATTFYSDTPYPDGIAVRSDSSLLVVNEEGGIGSGVFAAVEGDIFGPEDAFSTIGPPFISPDDILLHPDGTVFVTDGQAQAVFKIPAEGGAPISFVNTSTTGSAFFNPFGIALAPSTFDGPNVDPGDLIIADNGFGGPGKAVWAVNPSTGVAKIIAQGSVFVDGPLQVQFTKNGTLLVYQNFDTGSSRIVTLSADGIVTPFLENIPDRGNLAINPVTDDVYYGLQELSREIHRISSHGGTPEPFARTPLDRSQDMTFNEDGSFMFLSLSWSHRVIKIGFTPFPQQGKFYTLAGRSVGWETVDGENVTTWHSEEIHKWSVQGVVGDVTLVNRTYVDAYIRPQSGENHTDTYDFDYEIAINRTILSARWKTMRFDTNAFQGSTEQSLEEDIGEHTWGWFPTDVYLGG